MGLPPLRQTREARNAQADVASLTSPQDNSFQRQGDSAGLSRILRSQDITEAQAINITSLTFQRDDTPRIVCRCQLQPRQGSSADPPPSQDDTDALKAQVTSLTLQRDGAHQVLNRLEEFADAVFPAYQHLPLQELKNSLELREDPNSPLHKFYQTTLNLLSDLEKKQKRIATLTSDILRLGDTRLEANRDDYYFATKFTGVFSAVEELVYLMFLNADIEQQLEQEAENLLREQAGRDWQRWLKEEHLLLLTGVVTELLVSKVLRPPLLGVVDQCVALVTPAIKQAFIEGTYTQKLSSFCYSKVKAHSAYR